MKKFYVFTGEIEWKIIADKADIINGQLVFFKDNLLISAFNAEKWDVVRFMEDVETL